MAICLASSTCQLLWYFRTNSLESSDMLQYSLGETGIRGTEHDNDNATTIGHNRFRIVAQECVD